MTTVALLEELLLAKGWEYGETSTLTLPVLYKEKFELKFSGSYFYVFDNGELIAHFPLMLITIGFEGELVIDGL